MFLADDDQGGYFLGFGHRRLAACRQAGLAKVPSIVRPAAETPGRQIITLLTENRERKDLTVVEEAEGIQQLLSLGEPELKTQRQVAAALGMDPRMVKSRVALTRLPDQVKDRLHAGQITLGNAEAMLEFADDPGAIDRLNEHAGTRNFDYNLERERDRVKKAKKRAALLALLEAAGTPIIEQPQSDYKSTAKPINWLYEDAKLNKLVDEEIHQSTCPHAAVVIHDTWQGPEAIGYCTDPVAAGHHLPSWATESDSPGSGKRQRTSDEIRQEQEREERDQQQETAAPPPAALNRLRTRP